MKRLGIIPWNFPQVHSEYRVLDEYHDQQRKDYNEMVFKCFQRSSNTADSISRLPELKYIPGDEVKNHEMEWENDYLYDDLDLDRLFATTDIEGTAKENTTIRKAEEEIRETEETKPTIETHKLESQGMYEQETELLSQQEACTDTTATLWRSKCLAGHQIQLNHWVIK